MFYWIAFFAFSISCVQANQRLDKEITCRSVSSQFADAFSQRLATCVETTGVSLDRILEAIAQTGQRWHEGTSVRIHNGTTRTTRLVRKLDGTFLEKMLASGHPIITQGSEGLEALLSLCTSGGSALAENLNLGLDRLVACCHPCIEGGTHGSFWILNTTASSGKKMIDATSHLLERGLFLAHGIPTAISVGADNLLEGTTLCTRIALENGSLALEYIGSSGHSFIVISSAGLAPIFSVPPDLFKESIEHVSLCMDPLMSWGYEFSTAGASLCSQSLDNSVYYLGKIIHGASQKTDGALASVYSCGISTSLLCDQALTASVYGAQVFAQGSFRILKAVGQGCIALPAFLKEESIPISANMDKGLTGIVRGVRLVTDTVSYELDRLLGTGVRSLIDFSRTYRAERREHPNANSCLLCLHTCTKNN